MINLRLKLSESRELNIELPADLGELLFNGPEDLGSAWRRSCRAALALRPASAGHATCAALATCAVFAALAMFAF